jgi:hypothetical protein
VLTTVVSDARDLLEVRRSEASLKAQLAEAQAKLKVRECGGLGLDLNDKESSWLCGLHWLHTRLPRIIVTEADLLTLRHHQSQHQREVLGARYGDG